MRNKMSKLLSVLLSLVMLLSLAGPLAPSARAEGPYQVSLDDSFHGTVTADKATADEGETVMLTVTPSAGYIIESISVYAIDLHSAVPVTYSEGNYVFTMPASEVQASATFRPAAPTTNEIPSVGLALTLPAAGGSYGGSATASITSGTGFTLTGAKWFNGGTPETNPGCGLAPSSFEAGKPYFAEIYLTAEDGYGFTESTAVTLTGGATVKSTARDHGITTLTIVTNDYTIPAAAATTYTITVTGGTAHANEIGEYGDMIGAVITEAAEGDKVWLVADYEAVPEGKWAYGWTSEDVSISKGYNSFTMPAKPVTVAANYEDRVDKTYDLSSGTTGSLSDGDSDSISYLLNENLVNADQDVSTWDPYTKQLKIDLDKDGSYDLTFRRDEGYTVLESNSVSDQISFTLTTPALWIKSVTFLFKAAAVPYTVDLSTGKMDLATGQEFADLFNSLGAWTHMSSTSGSSTYYYDLDKDGTEDISVTNSSSSRNVLLLTTSNITTDTYVISDSTGPYNPITFILKAPTVTTYPVTLIAYDKTNGTEQAGGEVAFSDSGKGTRISGDYEGNSSRTVGVYPASDYSFAGWAKGSPSGEIVSTSSPYTFTVTEDVTLYALFEKITTYPVWVGENQVTSANKDNIPGVTGGTASFDPSTNTLTFTTATPAITGLHENALIYADGIDLTINAASGLTLNSEAAAYGIFVNNGNLNSKASLDITVKNNTWSAVCVQGGNLDVAGDLETSGYVNVNGNVTVSGNATVDSGFQSGIIANKINIGNDAEIKGRSCGINASDDVTVGGNLKATAIQHNTWTAVFVYNGNLDVTGDLETSGFVNVKGNVTVSGNATVDSSFQFGIIAKKATVVSGRWDVTGSVYAIRTAEGIDIPATHGITTPTGGKIAQVTVDDNTFYTVTESDGTTVAKHAIIEPGAEKYPVWVGGVQVTSANKDDILGDGKASFDPDTNTLTLNSPTVSTSYKGALIYAEGIDLNITGKATLKNENTAYGVLVKDGSLNSDANLTVEVRQYGVSATKSININGGSVNSKTTGHGSDGVGYALGGSDIKISSGTVTATSAQGPAISTTNSVEISGGTVNVTGGYHGISTKSLAISGGTVTVEGDWNGIKAEENITISGGTVAAKSNKSSYKGIYAGGTIEIKNGTACVTADGNSGAIEGSKITLGDALIIQEPAGGKLSGDGKLIQNADGTTATHAVIVPGEAVTTYPVWVGGVQVTSANKDDILGDGTASFDPATNTLTLDGLNVGDGYHASGASIVSTGIDLTVKGSATLSGGGYGIYVIKTTEGGGNLTLDGAAITYAVSSGSDTGIRADGNISISGGTIDVTAAKNGIRAGGSLTISGGTVNATGGEYGISAKNAVSVSGGTVTAVATMTDSNYYSAVHGQSIMITGGTVSAKTARGKAIYAYSGNVEISADVTAVSEAGSAVEAWYGSIVLSGGTIVAQGTTRALDADNSTKINNGITKVTLDGDPAVYESVPDSVLIGDALIIEEPEGGMLDDDKTTILESDGTTKAKHVVIVPGTTEKFPVEVVITTHDKDGNVISTVGGTATADKTEVDKGDTITVTVTPNPGFELESIEFSDGVTGGYQAGKETSSTVPNDFTTSTGKLQIDVLFKETAPAPTTYNVTVHAVDEASAALAGAKLQLLKDGSVLDEWTSTSSAHIISGLVAGDYTIHEVEAPEGYKTTADQAFSIMDADVEVIMAHARTEVSILSVDESESPLAGAYLQILDPADLIVDEWSAGTAPHVILGLKTETTYKIHEKTTPTGYTAPADQTFVIAADGTVTYSGETNSSEDMLVKHEPIGCTVTFETNGGSAVPAQTVNDGEKATKPADPTKSGFVFDGWYADATFSVAFDFDTPVTADVTVYAKWTEESKPGEIVYTIVSGGNSTWTKGSSSGVTIVVKRDPNDEECFSHFTSVQIDGTALVNGTDFSAVAGSTVITLNASALQKLTTGTKTVTINFDDGKATTSLIIKAGSSGTSGGTSPKTGDNSNPGLWITVMVLSGLGLGGLVVNDKKRRYLSRH